MVRAISFATNAQALANFQACQERSFLDFDFDEMCIENFAAFHGHAPQSGAPMAYIREQYCRPWRKTTIPQVSQRP